MFQSFYSRADGGTRQESPTRTICPPCLLLEQLLPVHPGQGLRQVWCCVPFNRHPSLGEGPFHDRQEEPLLPLPLCGLLRKTEFLSSLTIAQSSSSSSCCPAGVTPTTSASRGWSCMTSMGRGSRCPRTVSFLLGAGGSMGNAAGRLVQAPKPVILALRRWRQEDFSLCEGSLNYIARPYFNRPDEGQTWWCTPQVSMSLRPAWIILS